MLLGIRRSCAVVLADCGGCRSRRAALGPRSKDRGSSSLARTPEGERAQRANKRRKPDRVGESRRARKQRDRWRAPRDPTRHARKRWRDRGREHSDDGRRPGPTKAPSLTRGRRRRTRQLGARGSGSNTRRATGATKDVRDDVGGSARREQRRSREASRRGAVDRGFTRTARRRTRARTAQATRCRERSRTIVEAGGSPSSEAPPGRFIPKSARAGSHLPPPVSTRDEPAARCRDPS